jgi:cytochrome c biogenesis protein CcmG/thiol:disulfide interchange protein DsbE
MRVLWSRWRAPAGWRAVAVVLAVGVLVAGCGSSGGRPKPVTGPPCVAVASSGPAVAPLGDVVLPCFSGGMPTRVGQLGRPAVINLWASWCEPCQTELPAVERYAKQAGGNTLVLGVVVRTDRSVIPDIVHDLGLTFPNLYDKDQVLLVAVGRASLPVTLFVTADGRLAYTYNGPVLTTEAIDRLAKQYLP